MDMYTWYKDLYPDVEKSKSYSKYCQIAFGTDFSQQGFSNKKQVDYMLSKLKIKKSDKVLDIGCGTGKLAEYIADLTEANVTGLDYSPTAIQIANERTSGCKGQLYFQVGNMDDIEYPNNSFDVIYSIDTIFFSADIPQLLKKILCWLKDGGRLAIFVSEIRFDQAVSSEVLLPSGNNTAKALDLLGVKYCVSDWTEDLYYHMILKRKTAILLKDEFFHEGYEYIFDYIHRESIPEDMSFIDFKEFQARYLYLYEK